MLGLTGSVFVKLGYTNPGERTQLLSSNLCEFGPRPHPSTFFPIHHPLIVVPLASILEVSLNKP
jgi:hypothetical protein